MKKSIKAKTKDMIRFEDNKGNILLIDENLTLNQLYKMGVKRIRIAKPKDKLRNGWWREAG